MTVERKISSGIRAWRFRVVTHKTRAPRSMGANIQRAIRDAQRDGYTAASNFESAVMDKDHVTAAIEQHKATKAWLRKHGAWCAARIPRAVR
jgi:hypothetical protein